MAYTLVPTELIVDGAITSAKLDTNIAISGTLGVTGEVTLATHLIMGDNDKIKIGTGGDLEIYHDGSNSYISNSTGNIYLGDTNGAVHIQAKLNEESIICAADGAVTLYHDNSPKLATSSAGVTVTGTLAATLSTAAQPNITSVGTLTALTGGTGDLNWDSGTLFVDSSANAVGIGTSSPSSVLEVTGTSDADTGILTTHSRSGVGYTLRLNNTNNGANKGSGVKWSSGGFDTGAIIVRSDAVAASGDAPAYMTFHTSADGTEGVNERLRIDSAGRVIVSSAGSPFGADSVTIDQGGFLAIRNTSSSGMEVRRDSTDGSLIDFQKDGSPVGSIDCVGTVAKFKSTSNLHLEQNGNSVSRSLNLTGTSFKPFDSNDNQLDLGTSTGRFKDLYLSGQALVLSGGTTAPSFAFTNDPDTGMSRPTSDAINFCTAGSERMRIDSSGNVGIGVTPQAFNTGYQALEVENLNLMARQNNDIYITSNSAYLTSGNWTTKITGEAAQYYQAGATHVWRTSVSTSAGATTSWDERMRINSSGKVGINNGRTDAQLNVRGPDNSGYGIQAEQRGASGTPYAAYLYNANTKVFDFRWYGTTIGHISNANGTSISYNQTSDYRLKENVVEMTGALDRVNQLQPKRFNFIADADTTVDGFLAHEVQNIVPEAISGEKDAVDAEGNPKYQGIDHSKLVPLLTKAIQEQQTIIDDLKSRIETLENE